jgi:predicted ATPase
VLTRLVVRGFKNLIDVDVRLGPLTCLAGRNGVGKSNLFDAIRFLALLADHPFVAAATMVRGGEELDGLFTKGGDGQIYLQCDVVIPPSGHDDFNQPADASYTFLTYLLQLRLEAGGGRLDQPRIALEREELVYVPKSSARRQLQFPHSASWRNSTVRSSSRRTTFIRTTQTRHGETAIVLQSDRMRDKAKDKRGGGKPTEYLASRLPRTVLSSAQNAEETRTAVLLRQEMRSWRQLQLEPSALRRPDDFNDPERIDLTGKHVPATLFRLANASATPERVYAEVANRLAELAEGIRSVRVHKDDARKLFRFLMSDQRGLELPAGSLSDGTLRFVALAVMEQDPEATGVLCLEEPENGIHPQRVEAMLRLLSDMAVDPDLPVDARNPLRQVVTTTHSPVVIGWAHDADILFAHQRRSEVRGVRLEGLEFLAMSGTWRERHGASIVSKGDVVGYLQSPLASLTVASRGRKGDPRTVAVSVGEQLKLRFDEPGGLDE